MDLDLLNEMIKTTQESLSKRGLERNCSVRLVFSHDVIAAIKARYGMIISDPQKPFSQYMGLPFSEGKETQVIIEEENFGKGQCYTYCEVDGVNLVSTEALQKEVYKQQAIIEFLKKELIHKTCYRQVMKRLYRELKQQKKCNCTICRFERKEISVLKYAQELGELLFAAVKDKCLADVKEGKMQPNTAKRVIDYLEKPYADIKDDKYSILSWHFLKENPKDLPRNEDWVCSQDGLPCWYDIANDQWIDCEGTQIKTTAWCDMPHTRG